MIQVTRDTGIYRVLG